MPINISWDLCLLCPAPTVKHSFPLLSQETLQDPHLGLIQVLMKSFLCSGTQCTLNPVCTLYECSLHFYQSFGAPLLKPCWMLWRLLLSMPGPQAGKSDVRFGTLTPVGEPLRYSYFPVCGSPICYGIGYIAEVPFLPSWCGFFFAFGYRISFLVASSLFCWWLFSSYL